MEPLFDSEVFEKEKKTIIAELRKKKDIPSEYIWEVYRRLFFQNTNLSKSTLGTEDSINSITLEDVKEFKETYIVPANINFIVAGDIQISELKSFLEIKNTFVSNYRIKTEDTIPIFNQKNVDLEIYNSKQVNFVVGFRTTPHSFKTYTVLNIILNFLAIGRSSHLIKELRYKKGLVYSLTGYQYTSKDWATLTVQSSCSTDSFNEVISILKNQLLSISKDNFTQEILEDLRSKIKKSLIIKLQTSQSWVQNNETGLLGFEEPVTIDDFLVVLDQISIQDIFEITKDQFIEKNLFLAICGPKETSI
jgi:predicted Zn-dependent peptidase